MTQLRGYFQGKTIVELSRQVRNQEISCVQLTQAALDAIHQLNPATNAFVSLHADEALRTAQLLDKEIAEGKCRGPLHGIPVAIKDNIDTQGTLTTYGSHLFQNHRPTADARCVATLRQAGAVVVGKTLTSEFALGPTGEFSFQGPSYNPHDPARVTGGSSAGSAGAVAAGMVPIAIGTDTAGSIRIPASFCGVVGFKPSYGRISLEGIYPVSATLDHVGLLAQCVEDIGILLEVLNASSIDTARSTHAPRVAWVGPGLIHDVDERVLTCCLARFHTLFDTECNCEGIEALIPIIKSAFKTILLAEAYAVHNAYLLDENSRFSHELKERLTPGADIRAWQYLNALESRKLLQGQVENLFETVDLLVMPSTAILPPSFGLKTVNINGAEHPIREAVNGLTSVWNLLGLPAISIPAGTVDGLPCGLQVVAGPNQDEQLLAWLAAMQINGRMTPPWHCA